jgi:hypothetical protein
MRCHAPANKQLPAYAHIEVSALPARSHTGNAETAECGFGTVPGPASSRSLRSRITKPRVRMSVERIWLKDYLSIRAGTMFPPQLNQVRREWRDTVKSGHQWVRDPAVAANPGEAGGFRVSCATAPLLGYLKPTRIGDANTPRAANEKIVSDFAFDLGLNVPPVVLFDRADAAAASEETRCCISLVMYPEHHPWGMIWEVGVYPEPVQQLIRAAMARYSSTVALDLWIGQTDRNNANNAVLGVDPANAAYTEFLFLDHAFALNINGRWAGGNWRTIEMVPLPPIFRNSLDKPAVLGAADQIAALTDQQVTDTVNRVPEDYMTAAHKAVLAEGLNGRKRLLRDFLDRNL